MSYKYSTLCMYNAKQLVHVLRESHIIESWESSLIAEVHTPQYHTGCFFTHSTACRSDNHASSQKYFWILPKQTSSMRRSSLVLSQPLLSQVTFQLSLICWDNEILSTAWEVYAASAHNCDLRAESAKTYCFPFPFILFRRFAKTLAKWETCFTMFR